MCEFSEETLERLQAFAPILREARRLQIKRMEKAFREGWRVPEDICQSYRMWHASHAPEERWAVYNDQCKKFRDDIIARCGFPHEWNELDYMTLFAEISGGERMGDGTRLIQASCTKQ